MALILTLIHLYNINPKTKQLHIKERLIQPCVFSGGGTLCVLRQIFLSVDLIVKVMNARMIACTFSMLILALDFEIGT